MSTDMSEFYQIFFEEAAELLEEMETLLVDLDINDPNLEHLNAIFRVAHSIKGGAATFGFTDMTEVTHVLESLLDRLRKQELAPRADMIDAFLLAGDVVKTQLAGHRGEGHADEAEAAAVCKILKILAEGAPAVSAASPVAATVAERECQPEGKTYRTEFCFNGPRTALDNLFANLCEIGTIEFLSDPGAASAASGAELVVLDPCVMNFTTAASEEDLWEALAFVVDPGKIKIAQVDTNAVSSSDMSGQVKATEEDAGFGFFEQLYQEVIGDQPAKVAPQAAPAATPVAPMESVQPANYGRRASDNADRPVVPFGRRETDKTASPSGTDSTSIRVNIEKVDQLINLVGELVITQAMLTLTASKIDPVLYESFQHGISQLERNTSDLQESVMSIRMMPIGFVFSRFPRLVRDVASKLDKQVELKTIGEGTELDKGLIEKISDPLTHLVRNSLDHGIESPEKRVAAGKPAKGTVTLRAFHQGGNVVIEVSDDGAGLNREKILAKGRERGFPVHDGMSDQEVWQLIFEAGFSTADVVTDVSGRGVGMDVVKRNIKALNGRIEIQSAVGAGTCMSIRLPLTLAILEGMSIAVGSEIFIIPLTAIVESLQPAAEDVNTIGQNEYVLNVRGEYLPVIALHEQFNIRPRVTDFHKGIMVIFESDGTKKALFVDELVGQHQVVIKSLETNYRRTSGISGATIMGDGKVALIIDVAGLMRREPVRLLEAA